MLIGNNNYINNCYLCITKIICYGSDISKTPGAFKKA